MPKTILFALFFVLIENVSFSQEIEERLLPRFSKSELQEMQKQDPLEYKFLIKAIEKGVFIGDIPTEKAKTIQFDGVLEIDPTQKHTFISLGKEITDSYQYYKIKGTSQMLGILPRIALDERVLNAELNKSKK